MVLPFVLLFVNLTCLRLDFAVYSKYVPYILDISVYFRSFGRRNELLVSDT